MTHDTRKLTVRTVVVSINVVTSSEITAYSVNNNDRINKFSERVKFMFKQQHLSQIDTTSLHHPSSVNDHHLIYQSISCNSSTITVELW